jgi:hypothetical protein
VHTLRIEEKAAANALVDVTFRKVPGQPTGARSAKGGGEEMTKNAEEQPKRTRRPPSRVSTPRPAAGEPAGPPTARSEA